MVLHVEKYLKVKKIIFFGKTCVPIYML